MPFSPKIFDATQKVFTERESLNLLLVLVNAYIVPNNMALVGDWPMKAPIAKRPQLPMIQMCVAPQDFEAKLWSLVNNPDVVAIFHHPDLDKEVVAVEGAPMRIIMALLRSEEAGRRMVGML